MKDSEAIIAFSALSQATRLAVFRLLVERGEEEGVPAGEISTRLSVAPPTLSFHLKELERAGLVASERAGRQVLYRPRVTRLRELVDFLIEGCCGGRPETCDLPDGSALDGARPDGHHADGARRIDGAGSEEAGGAGA